MQLIQVPFTGVEPGLSNEVQKDIMGIVSPGAYVFPLSCRHLNHVTNLLIYDLPQ